MAAVNQEKKRLRTDVMFIEPARKFIETIKSDNDYSDKVALAMLSYLHDVASTKLSCLQEEISDINLKELEGRVAQLVNDLEAEMAKRTMKADVIEDQFFVSDPLLDLLYGKFIREVGTVVDKLLKNDGEKSTEKAIADLQSAIESKLLLINKEKTLYCKSRNQERMTAIDVITSELNNLMDRLVKK